MRIIAAIVYLFIGFMLVGLAEGQQQIDCPTDPKPYTATEFVTALTWPLLIPGVIGFSLAVHGHDWQYCEDGTHFRAK